MKCPKCGKWNQASMPHCYYCGAPLEEEDGFYAANAAPAWQSELKDEHAAFVAVDEFGQEDRAEDARDELADEMVELRRRKLEGEIQQRRLREEAARRGYAPTGRTVRTTSNRATFFSRQDDPNATLRPVDPRMVEAGEVERDAKLVYPPRYREAATQRRAARTTAAAPANPFAYDDPQRELELDPFADQRIYDGVNDSLYIPPGQRTADYDRSVPLRNTAKWAPRRFGARRALRLLLIVLALAIVAWVGWTVVLPMFSSSSDTAAAEVTITPTIRDDLAAHTITIPGTDGQRISIRELRTSAIVTGGVATFDILDHIWYDDYEDYLQETMTVTLSPYLITETGRQEALKQIVYDIDIPLSPIQLDTPDSTYQVVSTAMYSIVFFVREGSTLSINGEDYSDLVNTDGGKVSYNATVQPIGENTFTIVTRSQYCRENTLTVTLYREKQDIPLDLSSDIYSTSNDSVMTVRATTLPKAVVRVLSPYSDLDITKIDSDGSFTFKALFDHIGNNSIIITADYPGKQTTRLEYTVYYVPSVDVYSRKAWSVVTQYTDLMDNMELRRKNTQIYVCKGVITSIEATKPQRAFMDCTENGETVSVYLENQTKTTWVEGESYRIYADAYGMYSSKPWLVARYTYAP